MMMFLKYMFLVCIVVYCIIEIISFIFDGLDGTLTYHLLFHKKSEYNSSRDICVDKYGWYLSNKKIKEFPTINFEQFRNFYYLNKDSWTLYEYFVQKDNNKNMIMTFTYPEWIKYHKFYIQVQKDKECEKENQKRQEITKEKNRMTRCVLESVQRDIDAVRAEQQKNMDEAVELIKGVKL